jgi:hypothetical protein
MKLERVSKTGFERAWLQPRRTGSPILAALAAVGIPKDTTRAFLKQALTMQRCAALLLLVIALSGPAFGQGCAMCWSSANGSGDESGKRAMSRAVTMLLVPTLGLMAGFVGLAVRYNRRRAAAVEEDEQEHHLED